MSEDNELLQSKATPEEMQSDAERAAEDEIKPEWISDRPEYLRPDQIKLMRLVDDGYISLPDILGLPEGKSVEDIKKMIEQGIVFEDHVEAEKNAESLSVDVFEKDLLFHIMYYYGGTRDKSTPERLLAVVTRGLVSDDFDIIKPKRRDVSGSSWMPSNCVSVYDPSMLAREKAAKAKGKNLLLGYHLSTWPDNKYRSHGGYHVGGPDPQFTRDEETGLLVADGVTSWGSHIDRLINVSGEKESEKYREYLKKNLAVGFPTSRGFYKTYFDHIKKTYGFENLSDPSEGLISSWGVFIRFVEPKEIPSGKEPILENQDAIEEERRADVSAVSAGSAKLVIKLNPDVARLKVIPGEGEVGESLVTGAIHPWEIVGIMVGDKLAEWDIESEYKEFLRVERLEHRNFFQEPVDEEIKKLKDEIRKNLELKLEKRIESIIEVGKKSGLPVYDTAGNMLWPRKIGYEEVKAFVAERDAKKAAEAQVEPETETDA